MHFFWVYGQGGQALSGGPEPKATFMPPSARRFSCCTRWSILIWSNSGGCGTPVERESG